jgi:hypothetical protein
MAERRGARQAPPEGPEHAGGPTAARPPFAAARRHAGAGRPSAGRSPRRTAAWTFVTHSKVWPRLETAARGEVR